MSKHISLSNGIVMPTNIFGTFHLSPGDETYSAVVEAIKCGYRAIDTAWSYGNEFSVGQAINDCIKAKIVTREELFITTRLTDKQQGYSRALQAFEDSIKNLKLDYIDCYMIHTPGRKHEDWEDKIVDTWLALEKIYESGRAKSIGVSQFEEKHLDLIHRKTNITPMINQLEFHNKCQQRDLVNYCQEKNILVSGWGTFNSGAVFKDETLKKIAQKYGKTVGQLCLNWSFKNGIIPISRSSKPENIRTNFSFYDFELSNDDFELINSMDKTLWPWHSSYGDYRSASPEPKIPLSVLIKNSPNKKIYYLFGFIPFMKKEESESRVKYYLFCFLPILKIKKRVVKKGAV